MKKAILITISLFLIADVFAEPTKNSIPDEYKIKEEQLSYGAADKAISYIKSALQSFVALTNHMEEKMKFRQDLEGTRWYNAKPIEKNYSIDITLEQLITIANRDNLDWAVQNIGFHNRMVTIEGTLLRQKNEIKKLEFELLKAKQAENEYIDKALSEMTAAKEELDKFINSHMWYD